MPWVSERPACGFSGAKPWLPMGADHCDLAVERQEGDPDSLLCVTRRLIAFRNAHPAIRTGAIRMVMVDETLLVFEREAEGRVLQCVFNFGDRSREWLAPGARSARVVETGGGAIGGRLPGLSGMVLAFD